jgi:hypothetical protein
MNLNTPKTMSAPPTSAANLGVKSSNRFARWLLRIAVALVLLLALGWLAINIQPAPFAAVTPNPAPVRTVPMPEGLPAPVERYYRALYGEDVPVIESAVISGRGTMRIPQLFNLKFPARFRFIHNAGVDYRHYIELTLFGLPVLKVNEYFVDGKERQELPWGVATDNPKLDQGGNLGMWAESVAWIPALLVTDPRVSWEAIDDETAILIVPFGDTVDRFVIRFSETTGEIVYTESMRYADGQGDKQLWINGTWFEDGEPWFVITEERVVYNVTVDTSLAAKGP